MRQGKICLSFVKNGESGSLEKEMMQKSAGWAEKFAGKVYKNVPLPGVFFPGAERKGGRKDGCFGLCREEVDAISVAIEKRMDL